MSVPACPWSYPYSGFSNTMRVTLNLPAFIHITCSSFSGGISSLSWLLAGSGLMHSPGFHSIRTKLCWMQKDSPEWRCNFAPNMRDHCLLLSQRMPPRFQHQHRPITVTCNLDSCDPALLLGLIPGSFSHIFQFYYTSFPTSNLHPWYPENQIKILDVFSLSLCASWNLSRKWIQLSWFKWETFNKENIYRGVGGDKGINKGWWGSQKPAEGSFIILRTGEQEKKMMTQELSETWSHWKGAAPGGMEPLSEQEVVYPDLSLLRPPVSGTFHWSNPTRIQLACEPKTIICRVTLWAQSRAEKGSKWTWGGQTVQADPLFLMSDLSFLLQPWVFQTWALLASWQGSFS